jgi:hypothetical protein
MHAPLIPPDILRKTPHLTHNPHREMRQKRISPRPNRPHGAGATMVAP